ncbi:MAG: endo-1,4-beta-xylanase [Verrucomicrobiaceae bacterium]|nr:endo-1,4-beta-xylanase [Verrucomicrobiaceae bacterium]
MKPHSIWRPLVLALLLGAAQAHAAELGIDFPLGGHDLLPSGNLAGSKVSAPKDGSVATFEIQRVGDVPWAEFWRVHVKQRPANSWSVQVVSDVRGAIAKGDACLLVFYARAVEGAASGFASVEAHKPPKFPKLGSTLFRAGTQWQPVVLPFTASDEGPEGKCAVSIHLGGEAQKVDIGGLRLLNYGPAFPLQKLPQPRFTYAGREPDATWRKAAHERIEKNRKATFSITLRDHEGKAITDTPVDVRLKRHSFGFGTVVTAKQLCDTSTDGERYRAIVDECFSRVVFENEMKRGPWQSAKDNTGSLGYRRAWLDQSLTWLAGRHFSVRGHYLCWGPFEQWSEKLKDQPQAIREGVLAHMRDIVPAMEQHVTEWDALNHPAGWEPQSTIDTVLGDAFYAEVFREAERLTALPLWINEDQVFRPGRQQEEYFQIIQKLLASGVKPAGLGNQAHFHFSYLPSPEEMLANSERFAQLVPALQITEFDVDTSGDEALAADFTRDALTMAFSHPAYTGFVLWGFWEGAHWKPATALWRKDWSEKPAAKVWRDLICNQWHTEEQVKSDEKGGVSFRGFFGIYEISIRTPSGLRTLTVDLGADKPRTTIIKLPAP